MQNHETYLKHDLKIRESSNGVLYLTSGLKLGPVAKKTGEWLHEWALKTPNKTFVAQRSGAGWQSLSFRETLEQVRSVASGLLSNGVLPGDKIIILSGPSIRHAILKLASQYIGVATVPLAEQYSLIEEALPRLEFIAKKVKAKMVFAEDGLKFRRGLSIHEFEKTLTAVGANAQNKELLFDKLYKDDTKVDDSYNEVGPNTLAKILFTSGSTSTPKGVPQTHRMLCVNQAQYLACWPFLGKQAPVILDWMPWNHVFGGNSDFNMALSNGGTLYLDHGKPTETLFGLTIENLRLVKPTISANVPIAYAMLVKALERDPSLRKRFFERLDLIFYAGASLPDDIWNSIEKMALAQRGFVPMMTSSWGMTETAPMALIHYQGGSKSGTVGIPCPEFSAKLLPIDRERFELRVAGPNVMSGYFEEPEKTKNVFDDEGYMITGDAVLFADTENRLEGLKFDGRLTEDFKLLSAVWVQSGRLRLEVLPSLSELVADIVVTGENRSDIGLLVFPTTGLLLVDDGYGAITDSTYLRKIAKVLQKHAKKATGSSNKIVRALALAKPPSIKDGEITAKGSLNNSAILRNRSAMVDRLYSNDDPAVIKI